MSTVTIVTPTMVGREVVLLDRAIPSVINQKCDGLTVEHLVISDSNPNLGKVVKNDYPYVQFVQLNDTWRDGKRDQSTGAFPWYVGSMLAQGDYVGFLGDDDELLPHHVSTHVDMMESAGADFSVSRVEFRVDGNVAFTVGHKDMAWTQLDSDGVMCRRSALRHANWNPFDLAPPTADAADYRLVRDWKTAGLHGTFIDVITAIHHNGWAGGTT